VKWDSRKPLEKSRQIRKTKFSFLIQKAQIVMKKVKIMLTAVAILAVVGGALAFKAQKGIQVFYKLHDSDPTCSIFAFKTAQNKPNLGQFATTTVFGDPCTVKTFVTSAEQ
jgi:hypothetical protein